MPLTFSFRLRGGQWFHDDAFTKTLDLFRKHKGLVNEVMLFYPDSTVPDMPPPPEAIPVVRQRMRQLREFGARAVGLDVSAFGICADLMCEMGSELSHYKPGLQSQVNLEGKPDRNLRPCPSDPGFRGFQAMRMRGLSESEPDFIYLEDELRMGGNGKDNMCFCPYCIERFQDGKWKSREELVEALDKDTDPKIRQEWVQFNEARLTEVAAAVRAGIDEVNPEIDLCLMPVNPDQSTYNGIYLPKLIRAARARRFRPGHGWYQDADTSGMLRKVVGVSRLNAQVDLEQCEAQYECETWPGGRLDKSNQAVRHEITGAVMVGCKGFTINDGPWRGFVDEVMADRMADLERWHPAWNKLADHAQPLKQCGLYVPATSDMMARAPIDRGGWFKSGPFYDKGHYRAEQWLASGFSLTPHEADASAVLLSRQCAACATDKDLERWLSGGLICDATSAEIIAARGMGELTGVKVAEYQSQTYEQFTENPVTRDGDVGQVRWHLAAESNPLISQNDHVEPLGEIHDYSGALLGASITRFENELGGRVVVIGYHAWDMVAMPGHWHRLRQLINWASRENDSFRLDRCRRVAPFVRLSNDGKQCAIALFNTGFDPTGPMRFTLKAEINNLRLLGIDGMETTVETRTVASGIEILLPDGIASWNHVMLIG